MGWHKATSREALARRGALVFKHGRHQLAIIQSGERCFAIDNRCPHEGYPLSQGTVDGECVLTCNWHNWKFSLESGRNLRSGDSVRAYPVELRGDEVWVDLRDPPAAAQLERALAGLREGFDERDHGRVARQLARLQLAGAAPSVLALRHAIAWTAPRLEWGMAHGIPGAADWLALHDLRAGDDALEDRIICLTEAVDHMAFDVLRHPEYPFAAPAASDGGTFDAAPLLAAIEREEQDVAVALLRGAIQRGADYETLRPHLARAALRHYTGFGHGLIYLFKIGELVARVGPEITEPALSGLTRYYAYATREDLIPEFRGLADALAACPERAGAEPGPITDDEVETLLRGSQRAAFTWVHEQVARHPHAVVWDALLRACARSMLCFDTRHEAATAVTVADNVGWLDFTHALTFGDAVRQACTLDPSLWPAGLLQMACFCARNRAYRALDMDVSRWRVEDEAALFAEIDALLLDHGMPMPIWPVHILKTRFAVAAALPHVSPSTRATLLASLRRYASTPAKQKHARRNVHQALALVGV